MFPIAKKKPKKFVLNNDIRIDNYFWLRDESRKKYEVLDHLNKENLYTEKVLKSGNLLKKNIFKELINRIHKSKKTVPYRYNGYLYRVIYNNNNEYPIFQRKLISKNKENWNILVNGNQRAKGKKFYYLSNIAISEDNKTLAIAEDFKGRCQYEISFKNLSNKKWNNRIIKNVSSNIIWMNNNVFLYIRNHSVTLRPYQLFYYQYGQNEIKDIKIYEELDDTFSLNIQNSASKKYVFLECNSTETNEYRIIDFNNTKNIKIFLKRKIGHKYKLDHLNDLFYIRSNCESKNFDIYTSKNIGFFWKKIYSPKEEVYLENFLLFNFWLVIEERFYGLLKISYINLKTKQKNTISFNESLYMTWCTDNFESNSPYLRYVYSSFTTPITIMQVNMSTHQSKILKKEKIKDYNEKEYNSLRLWIKSRDGIKIPVSILYRMNLFKKYDNPILFYAYGAYGISIDPIFNSSRLVLLDRGFIYAFVHVRGGGDLGDNWYQQGKLRNKKNTFNDFIDATQEILNLGYGNKKEVYALGGSAGGLLMGVISNEKPNLYKGIISLVPFVDVLTTMLDPSIPLTTGEYDEWGNPKKDKDIYFLLKSYSPYDNVKKQRYPHMLVTTSLYDSQVQYWEPVKWVAKLREMKVGNTVLLLKINMNSGHYGECGRFNQLMELAFQYTFILMLLDFHKYFLNFDLS
ncbi:MAG: S9 family peptidase [Arsenophonus sp.]|nr:MAG: S9 family peptidase [Arsenophonus sp.]